MQGSVIADDDEDLIALHKWILARGGFELSVATNGHEALRLTREMRPNLVLTDYMMPGMNGLEVCRQIHGQPELADVPVVILTASCERTLRQAVRLAGATAYWEKLISPRNLLKKSRRYSRTARTERSRCCSTEARDNI